MANPDESNPEPSNLAPSKCIPLPDELLEEEGIAGALSAMRHALASPGVRELLARREKARTEEDALVEDARRIAHREGWEDGREQFLIDAVQRLVDLGIPYRIRDGVELKLKARRDWSSRLGHARREAFVVGRLEGLKAAREEVRGALSEEGLSEDMVRKCTPELG